MIRLALIGTGKWGKNYIRTIGALSSCELPDDAIKTRDYRDLLARSDIDGVIIATPPASHVSIAKAFIANKIPVLVEKPLTTSSKDALQLAQLAQKYKTVAMVGHIFLYHPHIRQLKKQLAAIGALHYILGQSMDRGPVRDDVSALWDWGPHDVATAIYLMGEKPHSVSAWKLGYGMYVVRLTFARGVEFVSMMGWGSPVKKREMTIVGENGSLFFDDVAHPITKAQNMPLAQEVAEFVSSIVDKREPATPLADGAVVVRVLEKAEESIKKHGISVSL